MFYIGVDLGQKHDFTAIAIVEKEEVPQPWMVPARKGLSMRYLERVRLGTPYTAVAARVQEIVYGLNCHCSVVVDATGVGAPVVDILRQSRLGCELSPVVITGGQHKNWNGGMWHVPKQDLVAVLQVLLEKGELRIAKRMRETGPLVKELVDMRMTMKKTGRARMGAVGPGQHDDLVMAAALACWQAKRPTIGFGNQRIL